MPSMVQWGKLNEFLLQVGALDEQVPFCVNALNRLRNIVSFDQGRVYFFDEEGHVFDEYLLNVSKEVTKEYHEYYGGVDDARYSATKRARYEAKRVIAEAHDQGGKPGSSVRLQRVRAVSWEDEPHDTRFYREYVAKIGLTYSTGFSLYDNEHVPRALFCIDRTRPVEFSREELQLLALAASHLDNMFRKLFAMPPASTGDTIALMAGETPLTERERQIATMLMRGFSTKAISQTLHIARTTVYKHVQNIHEKLGVSNQVELLARLSELAARGKTVVPPTEL